MKPILLLLLVAGTAAAVWGQSKPTNGPAAKEPRGFSLPYKKDGKTVLLITGTDPRHQSITQIQIKDFKVETYNDDGTPNLQGVAPECLLDATTYRISSDGPLTISQVGGAFTLSGVGFAWDHKSERLQLSNQVQATFRLKSPAAILSRP